MKLYNTLRLNPETRTLFVNNTDWGNFNLDVWVLERLALRSGQHEGVEFIITDCPIIERAWQDFHQVSLLEIPEEVAKKVLHAHNYRGCFQDPENVLTLSKEYGTDIPLGTEAAKDINPDALVFWYEKGRGWSIVILK